MNIGKNHENSNSFLLPILYIFYSFSEMLYTTGPKNYNISAKMIFTKKIKVLMQFSRKKLN